MHVGQHTDSSKLISLQEEKYKIHKEMMLYKDQVIELKGQIVDLGKEKVEWMASKLASSRKNKKCTPEDLARTISKLKIKYVEIKIVKDNLLKKEVEVESP